MDRLKETLHYSPDNGVFTWRITKSRNVKAGRIAGHVNGKGYRVISLDGKLYRAARIAFLYMTGHWPIKHIDHINHNRSDDSWDNLREVSNQDNCKNRSLRSDNTSGAVGVCWCKRNKKWVSNIKTSNKRIHLGYFASLGAAVAARKAAEMKYKFHANHGSKS